MREGYESVHQLLSPSQYSLFGSLRAEIGLSGYQNSQLLRYAEEAAAETFAQLGTRSLTGASWSEAIGAGLRFPLNGNYEPMSFSGMAREAAIAAAGVGLFGIGLDVWGDTPSSQDPVGKYYKPF